MVEDAVKEIEDSLGPIDVLMGVLAPLGKLWVTDPEQWGRLIDINLSGPYYCMRAVLPGMLERGRGVIVNVSSGVAVSVSPGWSAYAASKSWTRRFSSHLPTASRVSVGDAKSVRLSIEIEPWC